MSKQGLFIVDVIRDVKILGSRDAQSNLEGASLVGGSCLLLNLFYLTIITARGIVPSILPESPLLNKGLNGIL